MRSLEEITAEARSAQAAEDVVAMRRLVEELEGHTSAEARARRHGLLGTIARVESEFGVALEEYQASLRLFTDLNDESACAAILSNIGIVLWYTGSYPAAQEAFHGALSIREKEGASGASARVLANIGLCYMSVKDYVRAREYLHRSHTILETSGDVPGIASATGNIGSVYANLQQFPEALQWYHRSLDLYTELGDRHGAQYIRTSIANTYLILEEWEQAREMLEQQQSEQDTTPSTIVLFLISKAYLHRHDGDADAAAQTLHEALEHSKRFGLRSEEASCYKELRDLAEVQGSLKEYIAYNNEFMRITEEIKGQETTRRLALQEKERELEQQARMHERERAILFSTLPQHVAERVVRGEQVTDHYEQASVLFMDIAGFTTIADRIPAGHVVHLLDAIFVACDRVCAAHGLTKVKTIGDSYLAVAGVPTPLDDHACRAARAAVDIRAALDALEITMPPELGDTSWTRDVGEIRVRIGLHCGPVTAGVIGTERLQYDVWGDTVNVASRMESSGEPGRIHVSEAFATALVPGLRRGDDDGLLPSPDLPISLSLMSRGTLDIKGKGPMTTYWLESASA
jgi:class 3 adenylate cyclase